MPPYIVEKQRMSAFSNCRSSFEVTALKEPAGGGFDSSAQAKVLTVYTEHNGLGMVHRGHAIA